MGSTAESAWGDEAPRKKRVPGWLCWTCGVGCLALVLVAVLLTVAGTWFYRQGTDPEKQWPRIAELLPFDERPAHLELEFGMSFGVKQFHFVDGEHGIYATLIELPDRKRGEAHMDPQGGVLGMGGPVDPETGAIPIQGREVPCLRFSGLRPEPEATGPGIRLDLTLERARPLILELRRTGSENPIEPAEIEAFLAPFDVWRGR